MGNGKWDKVIKKAEKNVLPFKWKENNQWFLVKRHITMHHDAQNKMESKILMTASTRFQINIHRFSASLPPLSLRIDRLYWPRFTSLETLPATPFLILWQITFFKLTHQRTIPTTTSPTISLVSSKVEATSCQVVETRVNLHY